MPSGKQRAFHWCLSGRILEQEWLLYYLILWLSHVFPVIVKLHFLQLIILSKSCFLKSDNTFSVSEFTSTFPATFGRPASPWISVRFIKRCRHVDYTSLPIECVAIKLLVYWKLLCYFYLQYAPAYSFDAFHANILVINRNPVVSHLWWRLLCMTQPWIMLIIKWQELNPHTLAHVSATSISSVCYLCDR